MSPWPNQPRRRPAVIQRRPDVSGSNTAWLIVALRIVRPPNRVYPVRPNRVYPVRPNRVYPVRPNRVYPVSLPVRRGAAGGQADSSHSGTASTGSYRGRTGAAARHHRPREHPGSLGAPRGQPLDQHKLNGRRSLTHRLASRPFPPAPAQAHIVVDSYPPHRGVTPHDPEMQGATRSPAAAGAG